MKKTLATIFVLWTLLSASCNCSSDSVRAPDAGLQDAAVGDAHADTQQDARDFADAVIDARDPRSPDAMPTDATPDAHAVDSATSADAQAVTPLGSFSHSATLPPSSSGTRFGAATALSFDGNILAIGDPDGGGDQNGAAFVYTRRNGSWSNGVAMVRPTRRSSEFGGAVQLSADGAVLVVSDYRGDIGSDGRDGLVVAYTRTADSWNSGVTVTRPSGADQFGSSLGLSADGQVVAAVASSFGSSSPGVWMFGFQSGRWTTGVAIYPRGATEYFGGSVSLANDGTTIAIGDKRGGGDQRGGVRVFSSINGVWTAGEPVRRPAGNELFFGSGVALSADGNVLAVAGAGNDTHGALRVYSRSNGVWSDAITLMRPDTTEQTFGGNVTVSDDGHTVVFGNGDGRGQVMVFQWTNRVWDAGTQLPQPPAATYLLGAPTISGDGRTLVVTGYRMSESRSSVLVYTR